jgi:putative ABC transport system permease protein
MFGIIWGITSVILLVGLGIGFGIDQRDHLSSIGTDIAICFGGKTAMPSGGYAAGVILRSPATMRSPFSRTRLWSRTSRPN